MGGFIHDMGIEQDQIVQYLIDNNADATIATEDNWVRCIHQMCRTRLSLHVLHLHLRVCGSLIAFHYLSLPNR